jgi:hypothetical protein
MRPRNLFDTAVIFPAYIVPGVVISIVRDIDPGYKTIFNVVMEMNLWWV